MTTGNGGGGGGGVGCRWGVDAGCSSLPPGGGEELSAGPLGDDGLDGLEGSSMPPTGSMLPAFGFDDGGNGFGLSTRHGAGGSFDGSD